MNTPQQLAVPSAAAMALSVSNFGVTLSFSSRDRFGLAMSPIVLRRASGFESKGSGVAEVAVLEAIEKAKAGYAVESGRRRWHADNAKIPGESKRGKLNQNNVTRERTDVSATERNGLIRISAA
ncbi:MAG: hypothetical protein L0215_20690 [Gemmataceae bacterium]|nr:hypothetical protein [Gemmataceae bacterium]